MSPALPLPPPLVVPAHRLRDVDAAARLEWFESDGRGGGAAGTVATAATRREHGLLILATDAPHVLLARFEERVLLGEAVFEPGVNFYPEAVYPRGHRLLRSFALDPWPSWQWDLNGATLTREILVSRRARATIVRWRLAGADGTLELRPLIAGRRAADLADPSRIERTASFDGRTLRHRMPGALPALVLSVEAGEWSPAPDTYRATQHPRDSGRSDGHGEDLFSPGVLRLELPRDRWVPVACGTGMADAAASADLVAAELRRRESAAVGAPRGAGAWAQLPARLALAADALLVRGPEGAHVLSGFPALDERPDASLDALSGLCLTTRRPGESLVQLRSFARRWLRDDDAPTERLLAFVHAAADAVEGGVAPGDLAPVARRALETCLARGRAAAGAPALDELYHGALLRMRTFAPTHPSSTRYESMAARWRERPRGSDDDAAEFPRVAAPALPMLATREQITRAIAHCDRQEGGALALPAARLPDYARAVQRTEGVDDARARLDELLAEASSVVETSGLGHAPECLAGPTRGAPIDAVACAAVLRVCGIVARELGAGDGRG